MLSVYLLETPTVEIPLPGIIIVGLFIIVLLVYSFIYFRFTIVRKRTIQLQQENVNLKNEFTRVTEDLGKARDQVTQKINLLSNTSNEIKTPLNAIYGFAELLSDGNLTKNERIDYVDMILRNANSLLSIVNDIIDITKIEKGLLVLNHDNVNLNHFIDEIERYLKKELRIHHKSQIRVSSVKFLEGEPSCFYADSNRTQKIMTNLVNNAIKFTREGFIEFGYKLIEEEFILFFVSDSGVGIEKEYQKSIFDEFTQISNLDSKVRIGSGLGLAVSKNLAELMGGKMWVESVKGAGSTFYFTIPCEPCGNETHIPHEDHTELGLNCWENHTVLIVDDYRDIYFYFSETLVNTGINLLYADNGLKAIDLCKEHTEIELVLMDIQMPEMSGIDATKNIRKFRKNLPIIAQTAYAQSDDFDLFLDAGFNDLITKPIEKDILLKKMSKFLNK